MTHSALAVANEFIAVAEREGEQLTPMKLQKLVYFAHGWHLALFGEPLVNDSFRAWTYGPVSRQIYEEFRQYGKHPITELGTVVDFADLDADVDFQVTVPRVNRADTGAMAVIQRVWDTYGGYSAGRLSDMTHVEGAPWDTVRRAHPNAMSPEIPNPLIRDYFINESDE